jgi:ADP-ribose pyrophosphatase YjhB (NUDIX family)
MTKLLIQLWNFLSLPKHWQLRAMRATQDQFLVGVTGVIFNSQNEVLLFRHTYRDTRRWSLPGGYLKAKEHPKEGLEREVLEESGLVVSADSRFKIRTDRDTARLDIVYVGSFLGGKFKKSHEVSEAKFFAFEELPDIRKDQLLLIEKVLRKKLLKQ